MTLLASPDVTLGKVRFDNLVIHTPSLYKQNLHPLHTQHSTQHCEVSFSSLHCQMKFSSRNILIKIGLFQETPTACPSVKENRNKIENLPYGYDLKKKNMQTLEYISQVQDSSQILLRGLSGTR